MLIRRNDRSMLPTPYGKGTLWPTDFINEFLNDNWFIDNVGMGGIKVDVREKDNAYIIDAEMPGMGKEDIEINLDDERLTIKAHKEQHSEETDAEGRFIRRERRSGSFQRSFALDNVKVEDIRADMKDGILTIVCPKKEKTVPASRRIEIE